MARTRVAAPQFTHAHEAQEVGQQPAVDLNPGPSKGQKHIELAPPVPPKAVSLVAFMEEPVEILVHEAEDDIDVLVLNVNGEDGVIPRGRNVVVKRKFVQQLLDMRETKFTQPKRNAMNVEGGNQLVPKTMLLYPFIVTRDDNPRGGAWLQAEQRRQASIVARMR